MVRNLFTRPKVSCVTASPYRSRCRFAILLVAATIGCAKAPAQFAPVTIFGAVSVQEVIDDLASNFEHQSGSKVTSKYAGSSVLAHEIEEGAKADLFLSASEEWADYLDERNLVAERCELLSNRLVIVTPVGSKLEIKSPAELASPGLKHLALVDEGVPAGNYARQALSKFDVWDQIDPKIVTAADVRAVMMLVERGEAAAGIVYFTDTIVSSKVRIAYEIDATMHEPIRYPLVLLKAGAANAAAQRFYEYLRSHEAEEVFRKRGFIVIKGNP